MAISGGTLLGRYEIRAKIGEGGMGEVYRARDPKLGREVAIKVLPAAFSADKERLSRFEQEAQAAGALNHPNILTVYDVDTHDGSPFVVSELLEGETLRERLRGATLTSRKAIDYGLQVAQGLAAAHDKGIIHRDLKPDNIFITTNGRVKILDFGLAKLIQPKGEIDTEAQTMRANTDPGTVLGTVGYMSPEQVRGKPVDHRTDIFSFGAVLYEMLSGRRAFRGDSAVETLHAILKDDPPEIAETNRQIAPPLERIVRRCLEKNPPERFQSASDLAFALEALSSPSVITAKTETLIAPVIAWPKRRLWPILTGATLVIGAAIGLFGGKKAWEKPVPSFRQITYRNGTVWSARFAPDGQTIIYSAGWEGKPSELFSTRSDSLESRPLGLPNADIRSISSSGEMAVTLGSHFIGTPLTLRGTLARMPLAGGAPREVLENVEWADWAPDGKELAIVRLVNGKYRLEYPIGNVLYETDGWISNPRISSKGDAIAFAEHPVRYDNRGSVMMVDLNRNAKTLSDGWLGIQGLAWAPAGDEIWFAAGNEGPVVGLVLEAVTRTAQQRLVKPLDVGMELFDISRDGRVLLAGGIFRMGLIGLAPGETKERELSWLDGSFVRDITGDGKTILVDEAGGASPHVYLRKTDGSDAVQLGDGDCTGLSPDGKWAIASLRTTPLQLKLLPTGTGEARALTNEPMTLREVASWFPDGKRILFVASEPGHGDRCYVQDFAGGKPRPITPEGITAGGWTSPEGIAPGFITPDGNYVVAGRNPRELMLYPVEGGEPKPIPGLEAGDLPIRWSADGRSLFVFRLYDLPAKVYRIDVQTGRKEMWKELMPPDPAGVITVYTIVLTPDAKSYAYSYMRGLLILFTVDGLK